MILAGGRWKHETLPPSPGRRARPLARLSRRRRTGRWPGSKRSRRQLRKCSSSELAAIAAVPEAELMAVNQGTSGTERPGETAGEPGHFEAAHNELNNNEGRGTPFAGRQQEWA